MRWIDRLDSSCVGEGNYDSKLPNNPSTLTPNAWHIPEEGTLLNTAMVNVKTPGVNLVAKIGQKIYIVNSGEVDAHLKKGLIITAFGKGKFKMLTDGVEDQEACMVFKMSGPDEEDRLSYVV